MAFKIVKNPKAWWPVFIPGVTDDGTVVENSFEMRFRILDDDENRAVAEEMQRVAETFDPTATSESELAAQLVEKIAEDWRGVEMEDAAGGDAAISLPFTADNIRLVVKLPNAWDAIARAYRACRTATPEKRLGN